MAYPEKVLAVDEELVAHLHPHWTTLIPATAAFLGVCAAAGAGIAFLPASGTAHRVALVAVLVLAAALVCWLAVRPWLRWRTSHYVFTSRRVLVRHGVLTRRGRDIALQRISDVAFEQTLWARIVGSGTVTVESAGEQGRQVLRDVPHSGDVHQLLNRLIEADAARRTSHPAAGVPAVPGLRAPDDDPTDALPQVVRR